MDETKSRHSCLVDNRAVIAGTACHALEQLPGRCGQENCAGGPSLGRLERRLKPRIAVRGNYAGIDYSVGKGGSGEARRRATCGVGALSTYGEDCGRSSA